jgi:hypothetical protein
MRQFLGFEAAGVTPISFYRLYDTSPAKLGFLDSSRKPLPAYTAISEFMSDVAKIANPPVSSYSNSTFPFIATYSGTFPLDSVHIVGSRAGHNSDILALWQRSYTSDGGAWATMPQPNNGSVTISIAKTWKVIQITNLVTRLNVSYTTSSQKISFAVLDDPIEVIMESQ